MEVKEYSKYNKNLSFELFEKFCDTLSISFNSIQVISDIEIFRRNKSTSEEFNYTEELIFLGKKQGLDFIFKSAPISEIEFKISPRFPVAVNVNDLGWILITDSFGPLFRIVKLSTNRSYFILKKTIRNKLAQTANLPNWIMIDRGFLGFNIKPQTNSNLKNSILDFIQIEKKDIWAIAIYSIAMGILSLTIPIGVQSLVNILTFGTLYQPVLVLTFLVTVALSFVGIMKVLQSYIAELIQQRLFVRLAAKVTNLFPKTNHGEIEKYYGSELPNYFLDISIIQKSATVLLTDGLGIFLQTIIGLIVIALYHPIFIIFDIVIIVVVIGIIFYLIGKVGIETSIKESKSKHKLASWFEELNFHKTIFRSEKSQRYVNLRTETLVKEYVHYRQKHFEALKKQMIGFVTLQAIGSGLLLGIGGWLVIQGKITLGQLVASEIIVAKILDNFSKFAKYLESFYDLNGAVDKVNHLLNFNEEKSGQEYLSFSKDSPIEVKIKNLEINFNSSSIKEINLIAEKKKIIVIHDDFKKYASFLFDTLYGLRPAANGVIEVNSYHLQEISVSEWRNNIFLLRDLEIFSGSIAENIKLFKLDSDSSDIRNVLEKVGMLNKIQELSSGIQTEILRNGYPFSKEEIALLIFARAFLTKPGLLLIDGILNYLSKDSLARILNLLKEQKEFSTILISSNLPEIQKISDKIYIFKNGKFSERGIS